MPVVKLNFATEEEKRLFMGGLSDGWGENYCNLEWDYKNIEFDHCDEFTVTDVYDPRKEFEWEEDEEEPVNRRVTRIMDRYEMTFLSFYRNYEDLAPLRYNITPSSKIRFAQVIGEWHKQGKISVKQSKDNPGVYYYEVAR